MDNGECNNLQKAIASLCWYLLRQVEYIGHLLQKQQIRISMVDKRQAMMTPIDIMINNLQGKYFLQYTH